MGVRLVPVLLEFFVLLFLFVSLGPLSESGGLGGSVPATLCSGASRSGPSSLVLGSFGRVRIRGLGIRTRLLGGRLSHSDGPGMGSRFRGNDGSMGGNDG